MLGYSGTNGNSLAETIAMIDRSAAVDGTRPEGAVFTAQHNQADVTGQQLAGRIQDAAQHGFQVEPRRHGTADLQ